jgi:predicted membrane protein
MQIVFPDSDLSLCALGIVAAAFACGLYGLLPARWGWRAFPATLAAVIGCAVVAAVFALAVLDKLYGDHGYNLVVRGSAVAAVLGSALIGAAIALALRRHRPSRR